MMSDADYIKELEGLVCFLAGCYEKTKETYLDKHMQTCSVSNPNRRDLTEAEQSEWQRFPLIQGHVLQNIVFDISKSNKPKPSDIKGMLNRFMQDQNKMKELADRIYKFLNQYAGIRPDWDGETEDEKFTSPDASHMKYCADMLKQGLNPHHCFSEWGSGGYKPYSSREGRQEHDYLVTEIYKIINSK